MTMATENLVEHAGFPTTFLLAFWSVHVVTYSGIIGTLLLARFIWQSCKKTGSAINLLAINLCLADIVSVFYISVSLKGKLDMEWEPPAYMCPLYPFVYFVTMCVSSWSNTLISVFRSRSVINPVSSPWSKHTLGMVGALIWIKAGMLGSAFYFIYRVERNNITGALECIDSTVNNKYIIVFDVVYFSIVYLVPVTISAYCHYRVFCHLKKYELESALSEERAIFLSVNKRAARISLGVLLFFIALCLPTPVLTLLSDNIPVVLQWKFIDGAWLICQLCAALHKCSTFYIHVCLNPEFRKFLVVNLKSIRNLLSRNHKKTLHLPSEVNDC